MVEGGAGTEFPVVFYDGEREMNIGTILVYPMIEFKAFQLMLSQRIGISPNQISIYLCDKKSSKFEDRRRIPITGKVNFSLIAREKNCFFLVVLKRSRKSRNRKAKVDFGGFLSENDLLADNLILLRRNQGGMNLGVGSTFYDHISQTEVENSMYLNNNPYPSPDPFSMIQDTYRMMTKASAVCEECRGKKGINKTSTFHPCVNDPVIVGGFHNRYGPVGRPVIFY